MDEKNEEKGYRTDCEVCTRLIREKHRFNYLWKVACVILAAVAIIFGVLYFRSETMYTEVVYTLDNITTECDNGTIIVGNDGEVIIGSYETMDNTLVICISIIVAVVVIIAGGIIIAYHHKKSD